MPNPLDQACRCYDIEGEVDCHEGGVAKFRHACKSRCLADNAGKTPGSFACASNDQHPVSQPATLWSHPSCSCLFRRVHRAFGLPKEARTSSAACSMTNMSAAEAEGRVMP